MAESATEAMTRAHDPLLQKIRETALLPASMLPYGCAVKVAGEWCGFEGYEDGQMVLSTGDAGFRYTPGDDEVFAWSSPF